MELLDASHLDLLLIRLELVDFVIRVWVVVVVLVPLSFLTTLLFSLLKVLTLYFLNFWEVIIGLITVLERMLLNLIVWRDDRRVIAVLAYVVSLVLHHSHHVLVVCGACYSLRNY